MIINSINNIKFVWHKDSNFKYLTPITQVYGVCFDKGGNILISKEPNKDWNIPGGKPEAGETPLQTLKRELEEEVDITIGANQMVGYFEVILENSTIYQLRFACLIEKINEQTIDPASGKINERKFVRSDEFFDYVKIEGYRPMITGAISWFISEKI